VGKSSLLNAISPELGAENQRDFRPFGKGETYDAPCGADSIQTGGLVADTPGFSSLEFTGIEAEDLGLDIFEIREKSAECKFRGCLHLKEPKCAVNARWKNGEIKPSIAITIMLNF
jgi:ribosome biogenesis GTPase